jgi:hypothetical protein
MLSSLGKLVFRLVTARYLSVSFRARRDFATRSGKMSILRGV